MGLTSLDFGYGDCRDSCMAYAIESEHACEACADEERRELEQEENECWFGRGSQG